MQTRIEVLPIADLELLALNARFLKHDQFQQLVKNVKKDGALTSVPFAAKNAAGRWEVLSGNNRVKAAIAAGLKEIPVMVTDDPMTDDEKRALQLSHNAIAGEDDPAVLKQIYEAIHELDLKLYAGLDDKTLELLEKIGTEGAPGANLEWTNITFTFLPDEVDEIRRVMVLAVELAKGESFAVRMKEYDAFMEALSMTGAAHNVTNSATGLGLILALFERHLEDLQRGWTDEGSDKPRHKGWVPIAALFGTSRVPSDVALVIRRAIEKALEAEDIRPESKWKLVELLAADYLAGA